MPLEIDVPLEGEIPLKDFEPMYGEDEDRANEISRAIGIDDWWLHKTIAGGLQWVYDSANYIAHQKDVAEFCNSNSQGPYFIRPGFINARSTLSFIFFERADAEAFVSRFGESHRYKIKEDGFDRNLQTLAGRFNKAGIEPEDERLKPYLEKGLALTRG